MKNFIQYWANLYNQEIFGESYISEDKTSMIKKLVLPDIEDEAEKEKYKQNLISFFKSHSNYENKIDWNKFKTLTKKDFDTIIQSAENSKSHLKKQEKSEIASDIKNIFKSEGDKKFHIAGENSKWLFVAPLTYEAAEYCDSSINQGAGAKWCIGYEEDDIYWKDYIKNGSSFIMAFNKNYKNLSNEDKWTKMKYMIQRDKNWDYYVWTQEDKNKGNILNIFGHEKETADKMFDKAQELLWQENGIESFVIDGRRFISNKHNLNCSRNDLTSLEGAPSEVGGNFSCSSNKLTSLKGAPSEVGGSFNCSNNQLTSLKGSPNKVESFICSNNQLTSLEGCPSEIKGGFYCTYNQLTSLEGAPEKVGGDFYCAYNQLTSLKGAPSKVGGTFYYDNNKLSQEQIDDYIKFLKMTPERQKAAGLLDDTGHYNPKDE